MNEPSNFCNGECKGLTKFHIGNTTKLVLSAKVQQSLTDPPYYINNQNMKQPLNTKTLDPTAVQFGGVPHYNAHNLYGTSWGIEGHILPNDPEGCAPFAPFHLLLSQTVL